MCKFIKGNAVAVRRAEVWLRLGMTAMLAFFSAGRAAAQVPMVVTVKPDADTFVRSLAPDSNYGGGGVLSVCGSAAVNGSGVQNGSFDTLMRFPMSNVVSSLNNACGPENWVITGIRLVMTEMATPDNAIFNRGIGAFEIRWVASDMWIEGTGKPMTPTSDGVTWQDLPSIVNPNRDASLGVYTNTGSDGQDSFNLPLASALLADIRSGGEVGLYLTAASPGVGFNFNSRNFGNTNAQPRLEITALPKPQAVIELIAVEGTNAVITFNTVSNWTYHLQYADGSPIRGAGPWSNILTVPTEPIASRVIFRDQVTSNLRFYRLSLSQ